MENPSKEGKLFWQNPSRDQLHKYYPFCKYINLDVKYLFANLRNYKPKWSYRTKSQYKFHNKSISLMIDKDDYDNYNILVDYFADYIRLTARRKEQKLNPIQWYKQNTGKIPLNLLFARKYIYNNYYECREFRIFILTAIIDLIKPKKILDFSSGRGARLLSALSREDQIDLYVGVDPDDRVHTIYNEIVKKFSKSPNKYKFVNLPFEDYEVEDKFDLVFTCPPYFDTEIYNNDDTQSINRYTELDSWLKNFLFKAIDKSWDSLNEGGYLMLAINDSRCVKFVDKVIAYCERFSKTMMIPLMSRYNKYQPIWIWQKGPSL